MIHTNRVQHILIEPDCEVRDRNYDQLYSQLNPTGGVATLTYEESAAVFEYLCSHSLGERERGWLWKLLILGPSTDAIQYHAVKCVEQEDSYIRGLAFLYVQTHSPTLVPKLVIRFKDDPSPHVRYRIASTIEDRFQRRALLESILPDIGYDHELGDAIQKELHE